MIDIGGIILSFLVMMLGIMLAGAADEAADVGNTRLMNFVGLLIGVVGLVGVIYFVVKEFT